MTQRVQKLRVEYWEKVRELDLENLVFIDEMGILLGLMRAYARAPKGTRATELRSVYRGKKITAIGAITINSVLALMTIDGSMNGNTFAVFIEQMLLPTLWPGAVVIMDNLSAHNLELITPMIESVGAKVINLSPYSPDFNPIELWWSQLKSFLRTWRPTTPEAVDKLLKIALMLINPLHLRNYFASCCYCTS